MSYERLALGIAFLVLVVRLIQWMIYRNAGGTD